MKVDLIRNKVSASEKNGLELLLKTFLTSNEMRFEMNLEHTNWEESDIRELVSRVLGCSIIEFDFIDTDNGVLYFCSFSINDINYQYTFTTNNPEISSRNIILEKV